MGKRKEYWEVETPAEASTATNTLRYYRDAGRLQVGGMMYVAADGLTKSGKMVTVNVDALRDNPDAVDIIREVIGDRGAA